MQDTAAHFAITFSPSHRFGLDVYFALDFKIVLVDQEPRAVVVDATAWLDVRPPEPTDSQTPLERVFAGFVQPATIGTTILNFILPAYDRALTLQATAAQDQSPVRLTSGLEERET